MSYIPTYQGFSTVYDQLMDEAPYGKWLEFIEQWIDRAPLHNRTIVDLGCGTGRLACQIAKIGYSAIGVDLSEDMLAMAQERMNREGIQTVTLIQQDMRELQLQTRFGLIYSFCDSLNYIIDEEGLYQTFVQVNKHLEAGGLFLFDMHSPYKITNVYAQGPIVDDDPNVSYIWIPMVDEQSLMVEHHIHFFVRESDDYYRRYSEIHTQRAYSLEVILDMLQQANFEVLSITADFTNQVPTTESERYFFVAQSR